MNEHVCQAHMRVDPLSLFISHELFTLLVLLCSWIFCVAWFHPCKFDVLMGILRFFCIMTRLQYLIHQIGRISGWSNNAMRWKQSHHPLTWNVWFIIVLARDGKITVVQAVIASWLILMIHVAPSKKVKICVTTVPCSIVLNRDCP
jgi:hypothetical protein